MHELGKSFTQSASHKKPKSMFGGCKGNEKMQWDFSFPVLHWNLCSTLCDVLSWLPSYLPKSNTVSSYSLLLVRLGLRLLSSLSLVLLVLSDLCLFRNIRAMDLLVGADDLFDAFDDEFSLQPLCKF